MFNVPQCYVCTVLYTCTVCEGQREGPVSSGTVSMDSAFACLFKAAAGICTKMTAIKITIHSTHTVYHYVYDKNKHFREPVRSGSSQVKPPTWLCCCHLWLQKLWFSACSYAEKQGCCSTPSSDLHSSEWVWVWASLKPSSNMAAWVSQRQNPGTTHRAKDPGPTHTHTHTPREAAP